MPRPWRRRHLGTEADRATFRTLHNASLAAPALRAGLTAESAERSIRHLHAPARQPGARADRHRRGCWPGTARGQHHEEQCARLAAATVEAGRTRVFDRGDLPCDDRRLRDPGRDRQPAGRRGAGRRHPPGLRHPAHRRAGPGRRRGRAVGRRAARARRARRVAHPADGGRGAGAAGPDQPALHLQLARRDRQLRAHRPRPGPRAADGVRRLHPLLLPPPRRVHDARRGAPLASSATCCSSRPGSATGSG